MSELTKDFVLLIVSSGALQGFLLGLLLVIKSRRSANWFLGLLLLYLSYASIIMIMFYTKYLVRIPHLAYTQSALIFLLPPTFYFYIKALAKNEVELKINYLLHLLPFLIFIVWAFPFYQESAIQKVQLLNSIYNSEALLNNLPYDKTIFHGAILVQSLLYTALILRLIIGAKNQSLEQHRVMRAFTIFWILMLVVFFARFFFFYQSQTSILIPGLISIGFYILSYWALQRGGFFSESLFSFRKYRKARIPPKKAQMLSKDLLRVIDRDVLFRDPNLTAAKLAEKISVTSHELSQIISQELNETFHDLINRKRVEDVKSKLVDKQFQNLSIEGIGFDSGFKSKSAFYSSFKKYTGKTPLEFRELKN